MSGKQSVHCSYSYQQWKNRKLWKCAVSLKMYIECTGNISQTVNHTIKEKPLHVLQWRQQRVRNPPTHLKGKEAKLRMPSQGFPAAKWLPRDMFLQRHPQRERSKMQLGSKRDRLHVEPAWLGASFTQHCFCKHERCENKRGTEVGGIRVSESGGVQAMCGGGSSLQQGPSRSLYEVWKVTLKSQWRIQKRSEVPKLWDFLPRETAVELIQDRGHCAEGIRTGGQSTQGCRDPENRTTTQLYGACSTGSHTYSAPSLS